MWDTHINNRININVLRYLCDIKKGCRSNAQSSGKGLDILAVSLRRVKSFQIWADRESCCGVWHRVTRVVTCHVAVTISACDSWLVTMGAGGSKERLSKADMEFLLLHTHYDEKTIQGGPESFNFLKAKDKSLEAKVCTCLEWYRGFMSDCPEGKLNTQSFMKIYSKCFPTGNAAEFCDHVFRWLTNILLCPLTFEMMFQNVRYGQEWFDRLQRIPLSYRRDKQRLSGGETELGFQVSFRASPIIVCHACHECHVINSLIINYFYTFSKSCKGSSLSSFREDWYFNSNRHPTSMSIHVRWPQNC